MYPGQETKNAFISGSGKGLAENFGDFWANFWSGSTDNFDRMKKEMEDTEVTFFMPRLAMQESGKNNIYDTFEKELEETFGVQQGKVRLLPRDFDDALGIRNGSSYTLSGNLDEIYENLLNIQSLAKNMGIDDAALTDISKQADKIRERLDSYNGFYNHSVLQEKINTNEPYKKHLKALSK